MSVTVTDSELRIVALGLFFILLRAGLGQRETYVIKIAYDDTFIKKDTAKGTTPLKS